MKNLKNIIFLLLCVLCLQPVSQVFAHKKETHKRINKFIGENIINGFSLDLYLKDRLGFADGRETQFKSKTAYEWLGKGGEEEDEPIFRASNHFHNPVLGDIDEAGFSGCLGIELCFSGESSILWSQRELKKQNTGGYYSWNDVRDYFRMALTASEKKARDNQFAKTFQGLGQIMHLIDDMSVPEHVRDDGHISSAYEVWARKNIQDISLITPFDLDKSTLNQPSVFSEAAIPSANLFDSNQYNGTNPDITLHTDIGLSEYTNANFVSLDTLFSNKFPYPSKYTSVEIQDLDYPDFFSPGEVVKRPYYMKIADGDTGYRLAGVGCFSIYNTMYHGYDYPVDEKVIPPMDDYVFEDYADRLMPRAVGYAAALLEYFFRGEMDLTIDQDVFRIVNPMGEFLAGRFELYYDTVTDERKPVTCVEKWPWSYEGFISAGDQGPDLDLFAIPDDAKTPGEYMVVFNGTMGEEEENAVAASKITIPAIRISLPDEGYYALADDQKCVDEPITCGFDKVIINAENISPQAGGIQSGKVMLKVKYKKGMANQFVSPPGMTDNQFSSITVTLPDFVSIPVGTTARLEFDLGNQKIPLWATDVHLFLIFTEYVDNQPRTVCLGYKDISEPTLFDFFNVMDKTCLNGKLHEAGSEAAIEVVDKDGDGIANELDVYDHQVRDMSIQFSDSSDYKYDITLIEPGNFFRVFVLVDYGGFDMTTSYYKKPLNINDPFIHSSDHRNVNAHRGVINQIIKEDCDGCPSPPCLVRHYSTFNVFRGIDVWGGTVISNASYPEGTQCSYDE